MWVKYYLGEQWGRDCPLITSNPAPLRLLVFHCTGSPPPHTSRTPAHECIITKVLFYKVSRIIYIILLVRTLW
jgi:hypothetical protein